MTRRNDDQEQVCEAKETAPRPAGKPKALGRWYWGTAGLLIVTALSITMIAGHNLKPRTDSADFVDGKMRRAEDLAMGVTGQIDAELDRAFQPVYAGIPDYMEFHYSLKGEWLELGGAVMGNMESQLEEQLFHGLDGRISHITQKLQADFDSLWLSSVKEALADNSLGDGPITELVERSVGDARDRIRTTAVIYGGLGVGAASLSVLPRVVASKLGQKIAGKVAAKTGARWVTVASGGGTAAALCSWAGPGAAACAVVGMAVSWVGVDYAMIKLDEHVSREEFEDELRALVDEQKAAIRDALEGIVAQRGVVAQIERKDVVMTISLAELPRYKRRMACEAVEEIAPHYELVIGRLHERSPGNVDALLDRLAQHEENRLLAPWVDRVERSILDGDLDVRVAGDLKVNVEMPQDLQNGHKMHADLTMGELEIASGWIKPDPTGNFDFRIPIPLGDRLPLVGHQEMRVTLILDGGLVRRNREFESKADFMAHSIMPDRPGLEVTAETALETLGTGKNDSAPGVSIQIPVVGAPIVEAAPPDFCAI